MLGRSDTIEPKKKAILKTLQHLAALLATLAAVSIMTFCAFLFVKGDSALVSLGTQATSEAAAARRKELGTNISPVKEYGAWVIRQLHGDMGYSLRYKTKVNALILQALPVTIKIGALSFAITIAAGLLLGAALSYAKGAARVAIDIPVTISLAIPQFFLSVIVISVFSLVLHLFVPGEGAGLFPSLVISCPQSAILCKFTSSAITAQRARLYCRTARCYGSGEARIFFCHIMPNAASSILPLASMIAANVFTGSVVVEQVFGIPGLGRLLVSAVLYRDVPLCRALVLCIAAVTCLLNFACDLAVRSLDARIRV